MGGVDALAVDAQLAFADDALNVGKRQAGKTSFEKAVDALTAKGVLFARFGFFVQDGRGIWSAPDGTKVAWFHDPDLNLLSVVQHV